MMRMFGIQINQRDSDPGKPLTTVSISVKEMIDDILPYWNSRYEKENRLYVAPGSEAIFEPKEGDLVLVNNEEFYIADSLTLTQKINRIIMRDNKQFFQPLSE